MPALPAGMRARNACVERHVDHGAQGPAPDFERCARRRFDRAACGSPRRHQPPPASPVHPASRRVAAVCGAHPAAAFCEAPYRPDQPANVAHRARLGLRQRAALQRRVPQDLPAHAPRTATAQRRGVRRGRGADRAARMQPAVRLGRHARFPRRPRDTGRGTGCRGQLPANRSCR